MIMKNLTNKRLISYLCDHRHIDLVSVNKTHIICTCSPKMKPEEVPVILKETGLPMPRLSRDDEQQLNYIIFPRY